MPCARTAGTTDAITRPRGVEINREPLPVRREEIIGLVIRPKAESESSHKKITFLHKSSSQRFANSASRLGNPNPTDRSADCMFKCHPRQTDYLPATASRCRREY